MDLLEHTDTVRVDDVFVLNALFEDAEAVQYESNRRDAARCEALADALAFARNNPEVYVRADVDADDPLGKRLDRTRRRDPVGLLGGEGELAVRCAAGEAASRLCLTEHRVRSLAGTADRARQDLPRAWHAAREGLLTIAHVNGMLAQADAFAACPDLLTIFDEVMTKVGVGASASYTKRKARELADQLTARTRTDRHTDAHAKRCVYVEDADDGMSWLHLLMPTRTAHAIDHSLTATAKNMTERERDGRTREQIRADLATALLTREDTDHPIVTTKVFVTIPLNKLTPTAQSTVRPRNTKAGTGTAPPAGLDLNRDCLIPGQGTIDDATARQILLEAGVFTRVITDPVTGVILDMDRRSRTATAAQRAWLALTFGTCLRDGCHRLALNADIDHHCAYHGPARGTTDITNLDPLCDPDHTLKDVTLLEHHRRDDGTIQIRYPTGHHTTNPNDAFRRLLHDKLGLPEPPAQPAATPRGSSDPSDDPPF